MALQPKVPCLLGDISAINTIIIKMYLTNKVLFLIKTCRTHILDTENKYSALVVTYFHCEKNEYLPKYSYYFTFYYDRTQ